MKLQIDEWNAMLDPRFKRLKSFLIDAPNVGKNIFESIFEAGL